MFTSTAFTVDGPGTYGPASYTVTEAGTYYWIAYYSGDPDNNAVAGVCGETNETSDVDKASPKITTTASSQGNFPGAVTHRRHRAPDRADRRREREGHVQRLRPVPGELLPDLLG